MELNRKLSESQIIGQNSAMKFTSIGMIILIMTPILIGLYFLYLTDIPINIGGKLPALWMLLLVQFFLMTIGLFISRYLGRWAGKMILDQEKSTYPIAVLTLATTFTVTLLIPINLTVIIFGILTSLILGYFMGSEIERKGIRLLEKM